jgi:Flp pilus assembly protein TadD
MMKLEPPDTHALSAALGWLELGNPGEALAELDGISAANQSHPGVLEVRWVVLAELKDWAVAELVAVRLIEVVPENVTGWLHRAYALRRMPGGGLSPAWAALLPVAEKFPEQPLVAFNLACYACQLGDLAAARHWLARAGQVGNAKLIREQALTDSDLAALWPELRGE